MPREHSAEVVSFAFPLRQYEDNKGPEPGQYSYPFSMLIPHWLPASMYMAPTLDAAVLRVQYELRAQFTPLKMENFANDKREYSSLMGTKDIFIYQTRGQ